MNVLLVAPSCGLGGGIERYVSTVEAAFRSRGVRSTRLSVTTPERPPTALRKTAVTRAARSALRRADAPTRVVLAHPALLPVVAVLRRQRAFAGCSVIVHGSEAWARTSPTRTYLLRSSDVRTVAVSNFTAGVLARTAPAVVLPPALSASWFATLCRAPRVESDTVEIVTVFRLDSWRSKGLLTLLDAVRRLDDDRIRVTVCGSGPVPDDLRAVVASEPWCDLVVGATDDELAARLASAYVVVLASRTATGRHASGEGFGLTLLEAQVAGVPVIAPAFGGSGDAFQPGLTGLSPVDESAEALALQLRRLVDDPGARDAMACAASRWARVRFDPEAHADRVVDVLLGASTTGGDGDGSDGR